MDGDILLVNSKAEDLTGYPEDDFLNFKLREIFVTLAGYDNHLDSNDIREFSKDLYLIKSSSYLIPVLFQLTEIEGGKLLGYVKSILNNSTVLIDKAIAYCRSMFVDVKVKSGDNQGDIALIELPLFTNAAIPEDKSESIAPSNGIRKKALIIEDDKLNAIILKNHLQQFVDTTTAFSGNEALNIIEMMDNDGNDFDIIFTDIGLPAPWDGITLKAEIIKKFVSSL